MKQPVKKRLARWGLLLVLLVLMVACNQPKTPPQANPSGVQNTKVKPPKDKDHKHGVMTTAPALPKVDVPGALMIKEGPLPVNAGVRAQAVTDQVQLKFLIIASDASDFGLATYKTVLDRVGAPYDVFLAQSTPLTSSSLIDTDSTGKYNAILLTNHSLLYQPSPGVFASYFDATEWNTLWSYERTYKVRQVSLYTSYGTFPEDYCLRAVGEGNAALNATLTTAGARIFPELKTGVVIPITNSYIYRTSVATGTACTGATATSIMNSGTNVLGVTSNTTDGRERLALTFTSNVNLLQSTLMTFSLIRWASKGVFLGEYKHYLNVDVDDWYNQSDERNPDGSFVPGGFSMSPSDAMSTYQFQTNLINQYASTNILPSYNLNIAYNAGDADLTAPSFGATPATCNINQASPSPLTSTTYCLAADLRFINHTLTHLKLNDPLIATAAAVRTEIRDNYNIANDTLSLWITNKTVLKTGEYSGLGVYNSDPNNDIDPPNVNNIMLSNPNLLSEAKAFGIKYLHGNMSFTAHQPSCFNCGKYHPMELSLLIVPDWPTNIAYFATNPAEEESIYNCFFGPAGTCAGGTLRFWPQNLTYAQIIEAETDLAFQQHLAAGSVYTHTMHIGNLRQYTTGKNLVFDWLNPLVAKYATYYKTPLRNPTWQNLGQYVAWRNSHFATRPGVKAVWDRSLNRVTVSSSIAGTLYLSGATITTAPNESYGGNTISRLTLVANTPQLLTPATYVATLGSGGVSLQSLPQDSVDDSSR